MPPTPETAAETMAPPGTKGAATAAPLATTLAVAEAPFSIRVPNESSGVCRASVTWVSRRLAWGQCGCWWAFSTSESGVRQLADRIICAAVRRLFGSGSFSQPTEVVHLFWLFGPVGWPGCGPSRQTGGWRSASDFSMARSALPGHASLRSGQGLEALAGLCKGGGDLLGGRGLQEALDVRVDADVILGDGRWSRRSGHATTLATRLDPASTNLEEGPGLAGPTGGEAVPERPKSW